MCLASSWHWVCQDRSNKCSSLIDVLWLGVRAFTRKKGRSNITVDELVRTITPKGRGANASPFHLCLIPKCHSSLSHSLLWSNPAFYIDVQFTKSHRVRKKLWGESQLLFLTASQWSLRRRESERYHLLMWSGMMQLWCPIMWKLNCCSVSERSSCQIPYEANMGLELSSILSSSHHKFEGWPLMFYLHPVPSNVLCCFMYIKLGCKSILGACTAHSVEACIEYSAKQLWTSR